MKRYAKYKDSGVEWIGEIPEGWENSKYKYVFAGGYHSFIILTFIILFKIFTIFFFFF